MLLGSPSISSPLWFVYLSCRNSRMWTGRSTTQTRPPWPRWPPRAARMSTSCRSPRFPCQSLSNLLDQVRDLTSTSKIFHSSNLKYNIFADILTCQKVVPVTRATQQFCSTPSNRNATLYLYTYHFAFNYNENNFYKLSFAVVVCLCCKRVQSEALKSWTAFRHFYTFA